MAKVLQVLTIPDSRLRQVAVEVDEVNVDIATTLGDMEETMFAYDGVGLAAVQVNILKRLIVINLGYIRAYDDGKIDKDTDISQYSKTECFINPVITWQSSETREMSEGCLSVPGSYSSVKRPEKIKYEYTDIMGRRQVCEAQGLEAACVQHEIDHLNGVLYIDHLEGAERDRVIEAVEDFKQQVEAAQNADNVV